MSLLTLFQTICDADGLPTRRFRERIMGITDASVNSSAPADPLNRAKTCKLTILDNWPTLIFSTETGDCIRWQITHEQLRGLVLDGVPLI